MNSPATFALAAGLLACSPAPADSLGSAVTLELRTERGSLPLYPAAGGPDVRKAYAEAPRGANYRIVVHNNLGCRVGLVIAVDGRNIVSGAKSWLGNDERMYVLDPGATQEYQGWRTAQDRENRFYFTAVEDSYAPAFKDTSATGVVAMAVYAESCATPRPLMERPKAVCPPGMAQDQAAKRSPAVASEAGTGYGEDVYSPSVSVAFQPEPRPREKTFVKYEWRETLRRLGVIRDLPSSGNRLWDSGFAPPPPRL